MRAHPGQTAQRTASGPVCGRLLKVTHRWMTPMLPPILCQSSARIVPGQPPSMAPRADCMLCKERETYSFGANCPLLARFS